MVRFDTNRQQRKIKMWIQKSNSEAIKLLLHGERAASSHSGLLSVHSWKQVSNSLLQMFDRIKVKTCQVLPHLEKKHYSILYTLVNTRNAL